ncbi:MAG: hypothetical protein HZA93_12245 [Verrucomicrobia bacterium]|nr:hypothetical protein [Verrucomicrobiota bacterium]
MRPTRPLPVFLARIFFVGCAPLTAAQTTEDEKKITEEQRVALSPFVVESSDQGYYASQTLGGGRLKQEIKDLGSSIQVVTKAFMEDLAITGVEELFQYTTGTEVGGILGNYTGASTGDGGVETSTGDARRNPDGTSRLRGLSAPSRARNFFQTDIPFDTYNTERIDINRGANSFLFGLGSPSGLTNTGLDRARFRNDNEISTRVGSGGKVPSARASLKLNRILLKDRVALNVALLNDRTTYRQEPTYKNDDRQYAALTVRPFRTYDTVITAHVENGRIRGNAPDTLLPQQNLTTFLYDPANARLSTNAWDNLQRFNHVEGPTQAQWNALSAAEQKKYRVRNTPATGSLAASAWGNGAYGLIFDGTNGRLPAFAYTDLYRAVDYAQRDPFFSPNRTGGGQPYSPYHGNVSDINPVGWLDQGFTNLKTFDFSRANLAWDNDYYTRDFVNYNVALEQTFLRGRLGFEVAYDFQDLYRHDFVSFNGANAKVIFDTMETLWLPADPNYKVSGNATPIRNPNYGRPFVLTKPTRRTIDQQREATRFTGFAKYDFKQHVKKPWLARILGRHTVTGLADRSVFDEKVLNFVMNSFGDPEPALHIGPANARQSSNGVRNVPLISYIGPAQPRAFTDPNFSMADFILYPAKYRLQTPPDYSIRKLTWNLGPDATNETIGLDSRANGNEGFVWGTFLPREAPTKNYRMEHTQVTSYAVNTQSFFWDGLLVANLGYRRDRVVTQLNTEAPLIGLDEIPDLSPKAWKVENGTVTRIRSSVFGYGAVLNWPRKLLKLPDHTNVTVHYNRSKNFVPATNRVDQYRRPIPSPSGVSQDYGVTIYLLDNKIVGRFNWFVSSLIGASSNVSDLYNATNTDIFNHFGNLNAALRSIDADDDGVIDQRIKDAVAVNAATGLTTAGLTRDQAVAAQYPFFAQSRAARAAIAPYLTPELKTAYNYRMTADGASLTQYAGTITDTNDVEARGFEAEIVLNPTRNLRIAFNAARSQTINTNIAPSLTTLLNTVWLPHLAKYGALDWNLPTEVVNGNNTAQQINARLLDYYSVKGQEGRPQAEQRKWRLNFVTRYGFSEGRLRGFSVGGAVRWEDKYATGYPLLNDPRGLILPDIQHPYFSTPETSYDLNFGYRRRIFGGRDWTAQVNLRNLQNLASHRVSALRMQPDGTVARARFDPPFQMLFTNTVRF